MHVEAAECGYASELLVAALQALIHGSRRLYSKHRRAAGMHTAMIIKGHMCTSVYTQASASEHKHSYLSGQMLAG